MNALARDNGGRQRTGGVAALYMAAALLLAMPYFLLLVKYQDAVGPAAKVAMLADHHASLSAAYLLTYVIFGMVLAVLSLTLHRRLGAGAPAMMRAATAIGFIWACVLVASGMVFNAGMDAVVTLHGTDPSQAAQIWQAIEPVAQGLGGANGEILGGLWILLVSWAALRTGGLPRMLNWLGLTIGVVGVLSVVPVLREATYVFGLLQIVWLVCLGIVMMRTRAERVASEDRQAQITEGARSTC